MGSGKKEFNLEDRYWEMSDDGCVSNIRRLKFRLSEDDQNA